MTMGTTTPQIYVANLAAYNAGRLVGAWIDMDGTADIPEEISKIANGVDWAIHDYNDCVNLGEHVSFEDLQKLVELYEEHDHDAVSAAFALYGGVEDASDLLDGGFASYTDREEWAYGEIERMGSLPAWAESYFDYDAYGRDLEINGTSVEHGGRLWVFHG